MATATAARRKSSSKTKKQEPEVAPEAIEEDDPMADLEGELDEALEDEELEDLDDEIEDDEEGVDDDTEELEVKTEPEKKKEKKDPGFKCKSVVEKYGNDAKPCYTATAPFRQSPARNGAFKVLQDAGKNGLSLEDWVGEVQDTFDEQDVHGSAKGAVSFIQKATKRVTIQKLKGGSHEGNYVIVEPLADGSRRTFNKNGTVRKASK